MTNKSYWTLTKELLPMMCGRELNIGHSEHVTDIVFIVGNLLT